MNHLNSIILEGKVTTIIRPPFNGLRRTIRFTVESQRTYEHENATYEEFNTFDIEACDNLADSCSANVEEGRIVRVIGRLRGESYLNILDEPESRVVIIAEHVEYKPVKGKDTPCE